MVVLPSVVLLLQMLCLVQTYQFDYCDPKLCPNGTRHVACNPPVSLASTCGIGAFIVPMSNTLMELIVSTHNEARSKLASGLISGYASASRMPTMTWDSNLAFNAEANARACKFAHDQCKSTAEFYWVGQNLACAAYYGKSYSDEYLVRRIIETWFNEYKKANQSIVDSYPPNYKGPAIGHFTVMVCDRVSKVGCAFLTYFKGRWTYKYLVCNYSFTNVHNQTAYKKGTMCSGCTTGCSSKYSGLCNPQENIVAAP